MDAPFPHVPVELLKALDSLYPDQCPKLTDDERMVWFKAGQRQVVDLLVAQHTRQVEQSLDPSSK